MRNLTEKRFDGGPGSPSHLKSYQYEKRDLLDDIPISCCFVSRPLQLLCPVSDQSTISSSRGKAANNCKITQKLLICLPSNDCKPSEPCCLFCRHDLAQMDVTLTWCENLHKDLGHEKSCPPSDSIILPRALL